MSASSTIEWTDTTWNPVSGCTKVSEGCRNCYIERTPPFRINKRFFEHPATGERSHEIGASTDVQLHPDRLEQPLHWRKPRRVFVNSLSDLFHDEVPDDFIEHVWDVMAATPQHTYQILTKRPARMASVLRRLHDCDHGGSLSASCGYCEPLPNVWLGVSVEDQRAADLRIPKLLETPAAVRFLSCEPLLGPLELSKWLMPENIGRAHLCGVPAATSNAGSASGRAESAGITRRARSTG